MWALIDGKRVCQIEEKQFQVAATLRWVECGPEITTFHRYENSIFVLPDATTPPIIPDTVFQKAVKIAFKALLKFVNGTITKAELNDIFDSIKDHLEEITND